MSKRPLRAPAARKKAAVPVNRAPSRVVVEHVQPEIDAGRFAIKRTVGESVVVTADVFTDGHDLVTAVLCYREAGARTWHETPMTPLGNDAWTASFEITSQTTWEYTVEAWLDPFKTWRQGLEKKVAAGRVEPVDLLVGAELVDLAAARLPAAAARPLRTWAPRMRAEGEAGIAAALSDDLAALMARHADRRDAARHPRVLQVQVDRERARFSAWYEMFPRSCAFEPGRHGTLQDCEARLPYVASMGFDVLYLPPVHPIGYTHRKGRNNNPIARPGEVGSPWAIGSAEGGHKSIHPDLGTLDDFRSLVASARALGIDVAMDFALQCSPDHPYVQEHPQWFRWRPDGTVQYAENPPKKYQDIYPILFECDDWLALWDELKSILLFWVEQGVRVFRVDNPHTKPFRFWEWVIAEVRRDHPDVIFLAEAFTRPKVMYQLAKLGFSQSYTYFAWRNSKPELTEYFTELTQTPVREFFRPNLWPNTPDILTEALQYGGRPTFMARVTLAAMLGASYGIYGPAFELGEHVAVQHGSEEYLDSEKYEVRTWDRDRPGSLAPYLARLNRIRREHPALQGDHRLQFHEVDNEQILVFSKSTADLSDVLLVVVNLDPHHVQSGWVTLPLAELGLPSDAPYQAHDLLTEEHYFWGGPRNYVQLDPHQGPAHVLHLLPRVHREQDFDNFG
jgi:starch synthase (maltosyl-transferring)